MSHILIIVVVVVIVSLFLLLLLESVCAEILNYWLLATAAQRPHSHIPRVGEAGENLVDCITRGHMRLAWSPFQHTGKVSKRDK